MATPLCEHACAYYGRCLNQSPGRICLGYLPFISEEEEDEFEQQLERATY